MSGSKTDFGRRLFGDHDLLPSRDSIPAFDSEFAQELRSLIADSRRQQFLSVEGGSQPQTSPVHRCLETGQRQKCHLTWQSGGERARGEFEIERTGEGGLQIVPTSETERWKQIGVIFFHASPLKFEPFTSRIRISDDRVQRASEPGVQKSAHIPVSLGAATQDEGVTEVYQVTWEEKDKIHVRIPSDGSIETSFVLAEADWTNPDGKPEHRTKLIEVSWDNNCRAMVGSIGSKRPDRTREGYVSLRVSPVTPEQLWKLVHGSGVSYSDVNRFRAATNEVVVRRFEKRDGVWRTHGITEPLDATSAVFVATSTSREFTSDPDNSDPTEDPDDNPLLRLTDLDRLLLKIRMTSQEDVRKSLFKDVAEYLRPKLEGYFRTKAPLSDWDDLTAETLRNLYEKIQEPRLFNTGYCWSVARSRIEELGRILTRRGETSEITDEILHDVGCGDRPCVWGGWDFNHQASMFNDEERKVYELIHEDVIHEKDLRNRIGAIAEKLKLKEGAARRRYDNVVRKLRVSYALDLVDGLIPNELRDQIATAEGLNGGRNGRTRGDLRAKINTLLAVASLVRPNRVIPLSTCEDKSPEVEEDADLVIDRPARRERLSREDVDLVWWWLFEGLPPDALQRQSCLSLDELELAQHRIGRRLHAQTLIEGHYGRSTQPKLYKPGKNFLERRMIDERPLDEALATVRRLNRKWTEKASVLIRQLEQLWQNNGMSLVPANLAHFDFATDIALAAEIESEPARAIARV